MPFEAGAIAGRVDLDTVSFHGGLQEMHTHSDSEGAHLREVFQAVTEVLSETLGPAFANVAAQMQGVFAGFSEGPIIGALGAIGTAVGRCGK